MSVGATILKAMNRGMNEVVMPLATSPAHRLVSPVIALVTYTGRRTGRTFTMPVMYRRTGNEVRIAVAMSDEKQWWRNFEGDGSALSLRIGAVDHHGHGVAHRDDKARVSVTVTLDD